MDWKRRRTLPVSAVRRVAIIGGTHGNESNGVHLAKHFQRNPALVKRPSFETQVLLANTAAIAKNTRYVDEDLNRCYLLSDLADDGKASLNWERKRAREVDDIIGPKGAAEPHSDLVIDLHNTTSATGIALMMAPDDDFAHELGHHLSTLDDGVRIVNWNDQPDWPLCPTLGRSGMTFEVGPCPWGCIEPALFQRSSRLVQALLDYVEEHNKLLAAGASLRKELTVPVFRAIGVSIDYPRGADGDLIGMVHPDLQGRDFDELRDGDNLFMKFNGEVQTFKRKDHKVPDEAPAVHALFVNEAAYYEKRVALTLVSRSTKQVSVLVSKP